MNNHTSKQSWTRRNCIGKGSFGVVNLAVDHGLTFAVKSVEKNNSNLVHSLENEIRILKSLSSPYVVSYLGDDVTCEFSSVYRNLHMEYMSNGTIADVAGSCGLMDLRSYTWCITSALKYIHSRNIVHCDVKGTNVLNGNIRGMAKLADFGSAIELGVSCLVTRGSPLWMAPEVVRGEYIGPESDVWSLGCTVIEMLTGKPAWQDQGAETLRLIGYSNQVPELAHSTLLSDDLRDFLDKCLKRDRSERWSCDKLIQHKFLLSCTSPSSPQIMMKNDLSPRCVFDWCDSSSSSCESTLDTCRLSMTPCNAKQRIGKLALNSGVNWETEGWEVVRHVDETTTCEYSEESVSGSGGVNWEYTASYYYMNEVVESTSSDARGTMVDWISRDSLDLYRCYMYVWIEKMFQMIVLNLISVIYYTQWLTLTPSLHHI
ncbi:hypothetical protein QVD17_34243 [Tagetes erecta]|uniref:Protein kinase domain-containing protein n=1 Tax=Tagetes erecta TaxID=13708 RepID=A0AAD8K1V4_TARER|nr:hypothetical protein QVD17_34243 [Tagetes erecta]